MKSLILFFLLVGVIFIIKGQKENETCIPKIEYRYIPRTLEQEEYDRTPILATYGQLFTHASPFESSIGYPGIYMDKKERF